MNDTVKNVRWQYRGTAYVLGHDVPHDNVMMPFELIITRVMDPKQLIPRLFEAVRPGLGSKLKAGDVIIGGRNFSKGKSHIQAYLALRELGVGIMCESMPYNTYRQLIGQGIPFLNGCADIADETRDGDEVEIDMLTGVFRNHTLGTERQYKPMDATIAKSIELGGMMGELLAWVAKSKQGAKV